MEIGNHFVVYWKFPAENPSLVTVLLMFCSNSPEEAKQQQKKTLPYLMMSEFIIITFTIPGLCLLFGRYDDESTWSWMKSIILIQFDYNNNNNFLFINKNVPPPTFTNITKDSTIHICVCVCVWLTPLSLYCHHYYSHMSYVCMWGW